MARSIEEIQQEILTAKANEPALQELNSTSKTSIWRLWIYITAFAIWVLEKLFDTHKAEVSEALRQLKPHTARWYRNKALAFQYGFDLLEDSDQFDNEGHDPEQIEESKIIKYSAVTEAETESRLIVKIATEQGGELQPIGAEQKESFEAYLSEIKDAGVKITIINYLPDILRLQMKIYRDPLVLDQNGQSILTGKKPVEDAIKAYLKRLPFNGELVLAHLVDELQKVEGVKIPHITLAESKWIDADVNDYGNFQPIDVKTIPISGYFKIENFNGIEYVV
ncbi:nucleotidyltransferase [Riemerella anatipestifer]|uniref:nucleotidyltransferase n=1 Tax=Riemerella anatipestifer TaxID=34085 RepID=UPI000D13EBC2|nr:nucleotidyltransferase [Riemerella anatipestifer]PST43575.1 nucleotidyltransferase [Riemerella anatipestifer]